MQQFFTKFTICTEENSGHSLGLYLVNFIAIAYLAIVPSVIAASQIVDGTAQVADVGVSRSDDF